MDGNKKYALIIILLSILLVNVHLATWIFFFILFLPPIANHYLTLIIKKIRKNDADFSIGLIEFKTNKHVKKLFILIIFCLLTGFLTPLNITPYTYIFKQFLGDSLKIINEYQNVTIANSFNFFIIIFLLLSCILLSKKKISLEDLLLLLGLIFMSLIAIRNVAYFLLIGIFPISNYLGKINTDLKKQTKDKIDFIFLNKPRLLILTILFIVFSFITSDKMYLNNKFVDEKIYPVEAVNYLKKNLNKEDKLFNEYTVGSYLLLNDIKVFIDSRSDLYTKPFNNLNHDIFNDYIKAYNDMEYEEIFNYYGVTHLLLSKNNRFTKVILNDSNYKELYSDKYFIVLKKIN